MGLAARRGAGPSPDLLPPLYEALRSVYGGDSRQAVWLDGLRPSFLLETGQLNEGRRWLGYT
jgi:hypothetical protein